VVVQINAAGDLTKELQKDPKLKTMFQQINHGSRMSGHPAGENGIGWLRVDYIESEDLIYVDEIQSDVINQVNASKLFLTSKNSDEWFEAQNPKLQQQILDRFGRGSVEANWRYQRNWLEQNGFTLENLEEIKAKFQTLFAEWVDLAISTLLETARSHGIKYVAIASTEVIAKRDPSVGPEKLKIFYDKLPRSFGFKKKEINIPELHGSPVWVRTASRKFHN
jgi:hypothetical protein